MNLTFSCNDCGQRYRAPRHAAGKQFPCARCGWPTTVPGGSDSTATWVTLETYEATPVAMPALYATAGWPG
jgi:hypothetical protein